MQPLQQTLPTGLSTFNSVASCPSSLRWPPTTLFHPNVGGSVYGTYLTPLNSVPDPTSLSASALIAAAAVLQHTNPGTIVLPTSSTLSTGSAFPHDSVISKSTINNNASFAVSPEPSLLNFKSCSGVTCLASPLSNFQIQQYQSSQQQKVTAAANLLPSSTWSVAASTPTSVDNYVSSIATRDSEATNNTAANHLTSLIRTGMKREANIASGIFENDLEMHKWLPAKRANLSTLSSLDGTSQNKEPAVLCNGDEKTESTFQNGDTKCHVLDSGTSFPTNFTSGSFNPEFTAPNSCTDIGTSHVDTEVANMLNPLNMSIYGLPFSSQPVTPLYTPSQFVYPPLYSINNSCDAPTSIASVAATLSLNNFILQQQQQQQLQSHQLLRTQLPTVSSQQLPGPSLYSSYVPSPTLVTAAALAAAQQPAHDVHTNTSSVAFQQQQQALLLSLILRSQQAQLAAAQIAAAGYLSQNDTSRLPSIPTLQNHSCILDSSCSVPGALVNLPSGPYGTNFCSQNPMTNVAYINEKGHLLETLPICRDFKAGKCRRNSDCRYVHLVDENVEVNQGRVIVCRDAAKGRCTRVPCKYYHIPLFAISANRSMALNSALASVTGFPTVSTL
uniref:Muscleblind-like protein 3 n=2 Tax=Schistosoma japonicum TaxID=6182 RepID=C1LG93_SCHJA|nr:Muscleblind-like protein 3 [Schistosoma japonicum]